MNCKMLGSVTHVARLVSLHLLHDGKVGVGAAVYFTLSAISLSTLGLVGIGAGVGYGVGSWAVDKIRQKRCEKQMNRHRIQANFTHESFFISPSICGLSVLFHCRIVQYVVLETACFALKTKTGLRVLHLAW